MSLPADLRRGLRARDVNVPPLPPLPPHSRKPPAPPPRTSQSDEDYYSGASSTASSTLSQASSRLPFATRLAEASIDDFFRGSSPPRFVAAPSSSSPSASDPSLHLDDPLDFDEARPSRDFAKEDMRELAAAALGIIAQLKELLAAEKGREISMGERPPSSALPCSSTTALGAIAEEHLYEEILYADLQPTPAHPPPLPGRNESPPATLPKSASFTRALASRLSLSASLPKLFRFHLPASLRRRRGKMTTGHVFSPREGGVRTASDAGLHRLRPGFEGSRFGGSELDLHSTIVAREPAPSRHDTRRSRRF